MTMVRLLLFSFLIEAGFVHGQTFEMVPVDQMFNSGKSIQFRQVLPTTKGTVLMATSLTNLAEVDKMQFSMTWATGYPLDNKGNKVVNSGASDVFRDLFDLSSGIKLIAEGPGMIIYFVTDNNHLGYINYRYGKNAFGFPPFIFPEDRRQPVDIRKIWLDTKGNLFIGTNYDTVYMVEDAANINVMDGKKWSRSTYKTGFDKDSNIVITEGTRKIKKIFLGKGVIPTSFAMDDSIDIGEGGNVLIGTNKGLYSCDPSTGESVNIFGPGNNETLTITHIYSRSNSAFIWVSSLERGMGRLTFGFGNPVGWFPYNRDPKKKLFNPINTFCRKSEKEFLVAPLDSTLAVFNIETGKYRFLTDSNFKDMDATTKGIRFDDNKTGKYIFLVDSNNLSDNGTRDIQFDNAGNAYLIRGGRLFIAKDLLRDTAFTETKIDPKISQVVIIDVAIGKVSYSQFGDYEINNTVNLKYYQNDISILYAARGFSRSDTLEFASKVDGHDKDWSIMPYSLLDEKLNGAFFNLEPGKYTFRIKVRKVGENWREPEAILYINIKLPFWRTWWFWLTVLAGISAITFIVTSLRAKAVRKKERERAKHEKELLEMEARALRAQMNPHFIFNCMNSIKALIQDDEKQRSIDYLTTFSKLIRTLFQNSDKRQITLYDEIETCRLYTQLEAMRLNGNLNYIFDIDPNIDLKSVMVPALIIQPFIENAIWHGIVPKNAGEITIRIKASANSVTCTVDDNGIGREISKLNKPITPVIHESKGVHLSQARLNLERMLNETNATIETVDKYDGSQPAGTKVIITFNLQ